jgi:hypothetical protein
MNYLLNIRTDISYLPSDVYWTGYFEHNVAQFYHVIENT